MALDNVYQPGDLVPLDATFKNSVGAAENTTVALTVRAPDGTTSTFTPSNTATGEYHYDFPVATDAPAGVWEYIFAGSGAVTAAERGTFLVDPVSLLSRLDATALVSLADARQYVYRDARDNAQDAELVERINEYSRAIYRYTRREWMPQTQAFDRMFGYDGAGFLTLAPYEARNINAVTLFTDAPTTGQVQLAAATLTTEGEWRPGPRSRTQEGTYLWLDLPTIGGPVYWRPEQEIAWGVGSYSYGSPSTHPYLREHYQVTVNADWGIGQTAADVPSDVRLACLIAIRDVYENPEGFASRTMGALSYTEEATPEGAGEPRARNLPYASRALLEPYRRASDFVFA